MRVIPVLAVLCTGCPLLDVDQPISLVPGDDWSADQRELLGRAGECWNLAFGTRVVLDDDRVAQQVPFAFNDFVCTYAAARTEPVLPRRVAICKPWFKGSAPGLFFHVLLHELGHVLNIVPHAKHHQSVMSTGDDYFEHGAPPTFSDEDRRLFEEANPDFVVQATCERPYINQVGPCGCP